MKTYYVGCDISGRLSPDYTSLQEVVEWMNKRNPKSGDCVVWRKWKTDAGVDYSYSLAAIRLSGEWEYKE